MRVILLQDVPKHGKKDEIIEVADGFAKNYLIKQGLAVPESKSSLEKLEKEMLNRKEKEDKEIVEAEKIKKALAKEELKFNVKVGSEDRVFGSISSKQISEELKKKGYSIDKKKINISEDLTTLGVHKVKIELHKKVTFDLNVVLEK